MIKESSSLVIDCISGFPEIQRLCPAHPFSPSSVTRVSRGFASSTRGENNATSHPHRGYPSCRIGIHALEEGDQVPNIEHTCIRGSGIARGSQIGAGEIREGIRVTTLRGVEDNLELSGGFVVRVAEEFQYGGCVGELRAAISSIAKSVGRGLGM